MPKRPPSAPGQLHKTETIPIDRILEYRRAHPELLRLAPYSGVYYYSINVNRPPFNDVRVRQALAMAVDREALVRDVTRAGEKPAFNFTPDGTLTFKELQHARQPLLMIDILNCRMSSRRIGRHVVLQGGSEISINRLAIGVSSKSSLFFYFLSTFRASAKMAG